MKKEQTSKERKHEVYMYMYSGK